MFLSVFFIPQIANASAAWMNYALCISTGIAIPLVLFTKEKYVRSNLDDPSGIGQIQNILQKPFDEEEDNQTVFNSSSVPYTVI